MADFYFIFFFIWTDFHDLDGFILQDMNENKDKRNQF